MTTTFQQNTNEAPENALNNLFSRSISINWEVVAYTIIFVLAIFTRFYMLGERTMSHDESLHTVYSNNLYEDGFFEHTPLMHGPILFHMTALSYSMFGVNDFSARIYTAVLGVIIVMYPIAFRRWLGRTGAVVAAIMLLASPLMVYYSRYIRHDMPSILSAFIMLHAILMYTSGPENQRRRAHWLYILSGAMIWNLGSKETSFIYIAIFGVFLALYWFTRMAERRFNFSSKLFFYNGMIAFALAGFTSLAMIVVISISLSKQILPSVGKSVVDEIGLSDRLQFIGDQFPTLFSGGTTLDFLTFISWTGVVLVFLLTMMIGTALWAYRSERVRFTIFDPLMLLISVAIGMVLTGMLSTRVTSINEVGAEVTTNYAAVALAVGLIVTMTLLLFYAAFRIEGKRSFQRSLIGLIAIVLLFTSALLIFEERSHVTSESDEVSAPVVPGQTEETTEVVSDFTTLPLIGVWAIAFVAIALAIYTKRIGWWRFFNEFPEFDLLIVIGSLILPWATGFVVYEIGGVSEDFMRIGEDLTRITGFLPVNGSVEAGQFALGLIAFIPMMAMSMTAGLLWNWRRWLVCFFIFHLIFAFFFTTVFTNIRGLASGMVYSLQYWLEQQEVRRGSQPQYYYALIIMPFYEFLPIIGAFFAMIAGTVLFWRKQREFDEDMQAEVEAARLANADVDTDLQELLSADGETPPPDAAETRLAQIRAHNVEKWRLKSIPFLLLVAWWGVLNLYGYTLAGEKMPWLGTHLTIPLILLSGWFFGRVIERINWKVFVERGWLYLLLLPFLFVGIFQIIVPFLSGEAPFQGTTRQQLEWTYGWIAVVVVSGVLAYIVYRVMEQTGWPHLRRMIVLVMFAILTVLTLRSTVLSSFIHFDEATEFLVYAHAGPANKAIVEELEELSFRITDGMEMRVVHDNKFSWPGSWYLRDFENTVYIGGNAPTVQQLDNTVAVIVGDENRSKVEPLVEGAFEPFDHVRMWWPIQDYFDLNASRIATVADFESQSAGQLRAGLFDIWWSRDYTKYGTVTGKDFSLVNWPVRDSMRVYIRKDQVAQIWPYGIGDGQASNPFSAVEINQCAANWEQRYANLVFDTSAHVPINPLGMDVAPDGRLFVAEDGGRQVSIYSTDGRFLETFGQPGGATQQGAFFERPHSVAVALDSTVYVVDTWNYKIRAFTENLSFITDWGQPVTEGFDVQPVPVDGFWGPRDIAVDTTGRIYVADTGNKRVRVYTADGTFLRDIGSGGAGDGQLNEPAGLAVHSDGRLFVADTWNRRIAVFNIEDSTFIANYPVSGWFEELGNRPYLALDEARNLLYVTDPDAGRVLIYDTDGNCLSSFGQLNLEAPDASEFATVGGIAVDEAGHVYVSDIALGRILRFAPYEPTEPIMIDPIEGEGESAVEALSDGQVQIQLDTGVESTDEAIPQLDEDVFDEPEDADE